MKKSSSNVKERESVGTWNKQELQMDYNYSDIIKNAVILHL